MAVIASPFGPNLITTQLSNETKEKGKESPSSNPSYSCICVARRRRANHKQRRRCKISRPSGGGGGGGGEGEREVTDGDGRRRRGRRQQRRVLPAVLRGAQGEVWSRVPRVRVPPRRQAPLRQQLQLQERHHDPQGGLRLPLRPPRGPEDHPGVRDYEGGRQQLAGARPRGEAGARDCHGQRAHLLHHLQDWIPRRRPDQQGP